MYRTSSGGLRWTGRDGHVSKVSGVKSLVESDGSSLKIACRVY